MDNQPAVRVRDRLADLQKQVQLFPHPDADSKDVDRQALDILHHQKRPPFFRVTGIDQMNNGWVMQRGQKLSLSEKTAAPRWAVAIGAEELERDPLLYLAIGALRQIDISHTALADQGDDRSEERRVGKEWRSSSS